MLEQGVPLDSAGRISACGDSMSAEVFKVLGRRHLVIDMSK